MKTLSMVISASIAGFMLSASAAHAQDPDADLRRAYKKEHTYLEAQKRSLEDRLSKMRRADASKLERERGEVDRLQGRVIALTLEGDKLQEKLRDVERQATVVSENRDILENVVRQARGSLDTYGRSIPAVKPPKEGERSEPELVQRARALTVAFDQATALLSEFQEVRVESGHFFARDGSKLSGEIVRVGNIAAYGVSARVAGVLAPAGAGRLKIWDRPGEATAKALVNKTSPDRIEVFLFESLEKDIEERAEKTWLQIIDDGGAVGWVIMIMGALGLLLVMIRVAYLLAAAAGMRRLVKRVDEAVGRDDLAGALSTASSSRGPAARVLAATVGALDRDREALEDVVAEALLHETPAIERFGATVTVFAAVAPLLGLLGTVTGMISTFDIITEFGTGDPKMLSGGISIALITTQLGLIVAIPLLLLGNITGGLATNILTRLERAALTIMNTYGGERLTVEQLRAAVARRHDARADNQGCGE